MARNLLHRKNLLIIVFLLVACLGIKAQNAQQPVLHATVRSALDIPLDSLTTEQRQMWMEQAERIYYAAESPYRDEETYIKVLEKILASRKIPEVEKERPRFQLRQCMKNRVGEKVADFRFIDNKRTSGSFYETCITQLSNDSSSVPPDSSFILLYFFNPDCHDCERTSSVLGSDSIISATVGKGLLRVLPVYPDEDLTGWQKVVAGDVTEGTLPAVRFASMSEREKFHLPAIPLLYLLKADGTVVMKDTTIECLIQYLQAKLRQSNQNK